jgi:hypothetical protein
VAGVGFDPVQPRGQPHRGQDRRRGASHGLRRYGAGALAGLILVLAILSATGWLYLLRDLGILDAGPRVRGALPLQQLAGGDAQPLLRVVLAWLPAGVVAGMALARLTRLGAAGRAGVVAVMAGLLLVGVGAAEDAAAISDPIPSHLSGQLHRPGNWVAVALLVTGSLLAGRTRSSRRRGAPATWP